MRAFVWALASLALVTAGCSSLPSCPSSAPADGSSCSHRGFVCEFGGGEHDRCSTIATCSNTPTSTWSVEHDSTCTPNNDPSCAVDFNSNAVGSTCPTSGVDCDYTDGRCSCVPCAGGMSSGQTGFAWQCRAWSQDIDAQCPSERPALGSSCKKDGLICRYDNQCTVSFGPDIQCLSERWQPLTGGTTSCATPTCGLAN